MGLKRKRSSFEASPSSSTSSLSPPPDPMSPTPIRSMPGAVPMDLDHSISSHEATQWTFEWDRESQFSLNSRTRKRFRDNRPDEEAIHSKRSYQSICEVTLSDFCRKYSSKALWCTKDHAHYRTSTSSVNRSANKADHCATYHPPLFLVSANTNQSHVQLVCEQSDTANFLGRTSMQRL
jgi:hypothetical protein